MQNRLFFISLICLLIISCKEQLKNDSDKIKVGLVFDVGGRGDKSFNDAAYKGLEKAKNELGIEFEYIEPGTGADREAALRQFSARKDVKLILGIGFIFTDEITKMATEFPDKKFACVDYTVNPEKKIPDNLLALVFREEEGSFLVGVIAGLMTKSNKVGFVGGMESPLIRKFLVSYEAGVKHVNPGCEVLSAYAGITGDAFKNPSRGKELALSQYNMGADIIYHASGITGLGVFEAARLKGKYVIGVDLDQSNEAPGLVLTSMIKVVDVAVYETIKQVVEGKFQGGKVRTFGLETGGVDYVYNQSNSNLIDTGVRNKIEHLRQEIILGNISIPTR